ncbi:distal tail protein Dit [Lacticaseibacillus paracasei]|uniref:distal tail protein Dit n=1 Tax=Lacticaseibacillus paracasei TaxID=1597 RepID=UPI0031D362C2
MYDFRETTPFKGSDDNQRPAEAMLIDGKYIEDLIPGYSTLQVSGRELLNQSIEKQTIGKSDGEFIQYARNPSREIVVSYRIAAADNLSFRQAFYKLNSILHGDSHQVSFNDDPSKYWIATFSDIDDVPKGRNAITSSFTLFVPDGIAHSVATKTADNMPYKDVPMNLIAGTSADPVSVTGSGWNIKELGSYNNPVVGQKYAATVLIGQADFTVSFQIWANDINGNRIHLDGFPVTTQIGANQRSTIVCTWPDPGATGADQIEVTLAWAFQKTDVGTYQYLKAKLEEGTAYSTWSPNPADSAYYSNTLTLNNAGTYPSEPVITATINGDDGVLTAINDQGSVLQFGSPDETDGFVKQKSERVYHLDFNQTPTGVTLNKGVTAFPYYEHGNAANVQSGPFGYAKGIAYPSTERTPGNFWNGPSISGTIPKNSNGSNTANFQFVNRVNVDTSGPEVGRFEFNLTYKGKIVASLALFDDSPANDQLVFSGTLFDGKDAKMVFFDLLPRNYYRGGNYNAVITKMGNKLTFRLDRLDLGDGGIEPVDIGGFPAMPIDGWTAWFPGFSDQRGWSINWQDSYFDWINVDYWDDIPNRFKDGDVVQIDVANRRVLVNGAEDRTLQTIGNDWGGFKIQPGNNTIKLLTSSWAKQCKAEVSWQEAWL